MGAGLLVNIVMNSGRRIICSVGHVVRVCGMCASISMPGEVRSSIAAAPVASPLRRESDRYSEVLYTSPLLILQFLSPLFQNLGCSSA